MPNRSDRARIRSRDREWRANRHVSLLATSPSLSALTWFTARLQPPPSRDAGVGLFGKQIAPERGIYASMLVRLISDTRYLEDLDEMHRRSSRRSRDNEYWEKRPALPKTKYVPSAYCYRSTTEQVAADYTDLQECLNEPLDDELAML
ncbi:hypothetical protein BO71DRAFT_436156 [Aspergillus ellipticus CBS 707.79]|uniref:Uncharacterized protein n=1 Tax=Aspergillus ellipticus CBS 707.79 TaxID=1448320 RepID=A0A319D0D5_9EURO|nr:hypothetical protein BO71DRAFT_436156 [Aspergillus ellipticus CBS 707.79]